MIESALGVDESDLTRALLLELTRAVESDLTRALLNQTRTSNDPWSLRVYCRSFTTI